MINFKCFLSNINAINEKHKNGSPAVKAAFWFVVCNIILKGLSFISAPIFTRILPQDEYGKLSVFNSYEQIILIFATWEIPLSAYQRGIFKYKDEINLLTLSNQTFTNILTIITFAFLLIFYKPFKSLTGITNAMFLMIFTYLLVQPAYSAWIVKERTEYKYKPVVAATVIVAVLGIIFPLTAVLTINRTAEIRFLFTLLPQIPIFLALYVKAIKNYNASEKQNSDKFFHTMKKHWIFFLSFTPPLALHSLSYMVLGQADRIMIGNMVSNSSAAMYNVAYGFAHISQIIESAASQVLTPWIYDKMDKKDYSNIRKNTTIIILSVGLLYLMFILVSPEIIKLFFPNSYYECVWCIPPLSIGAYYMFIYNMFVNIELYFEQTKYVAYVSCFCAVLNVVLNYFGINYYGYIAAAYTSLFCYLVFTVGHYCFMKKIIKNKDGNIRIYNGKIIIMICFFVFILMVLLMLLYPYPIVRYSLLIITAILIAVYSRKLIPYYKQFLKKKDQT